MSFRNARGAVLAHATLPADRAAACDPIGFKIGSHMQRPLVDNLTRGSFVGLLQQLTGLRLIQSNRE